MVASDLLSTFVSRKILARPTTVGANLVDLLRLVLIHASNNFSELSDPSCLPPKMFKTVLRFSSEFFFYLLRHFQGPTMKVIARKLFQVGIETDDTRLIGLLLDKKIFKIDLNADIILDGKHKFTPIEYAARCNSLRTTKALCERHVDVNKTYTREPENGALNGAIFHLAETSVDLIRILIEANAKIHPEAIIRLIRQQQTKAAEFLIRVKAADCHEEWSTKGMFHDAVRLLEAKISLKVIDVMITVDADMNFHLQSKARDAQQQEPHLVTLLDIAAYRGEFDLAEKLLSLHALLTQDTLSYAIRSGNATLVAHILWCGAELDAVTTFGSTPFAEAVRAKNDELVQRFIEKGALSQLKEKNRFQAAMEAASEVGNINLIRDLLKIRAETSAIDLVIYGLPTAVKMDQTAVALVLIEAGAEVDDETLGLSLDRHSLPIARAILEAGVIFGKEPIVLKAVKWGDIALIKDLLAAGADVNTPPGSA